MYSAALSSHSFVIQEGRYLLHLWHSNFLNFICVWEWSISNLRLLLGGLPHRAHTPFWASSISSYKCLCASKKSLCLLGLRRFLTTKNDSLSFSPTLRTEG